MMVPGPAVLRSLPSGRSIFLEWWVLVLMEVRARWKFSSSSYCLISVMQCCSLRCCFYMMLLRLSVRREPWRGRSGKYDDSQTTCWGCWACPPWEERSSSRSPPPTRSPSSLSPRAAAAGSFAPLSGSAPRRVVSRRVPRSEGCAPGIPTGSSSSPTWTRCSSLTRPPRPSGELNPNLVTAHWVTMTQQKGKS